MKHPGTINDIAENKTNDFEWSDKNKSEIEIILKKYPPDRKQSAVIPILDLAQRQNKGFINVDIIEKVANLLDMSFIRVMEIATFYSMFNLKPIGENFIQICKTTPCWLRGSDKIVKVAKEVTGCDIGETSIDKKFTVVEVECLGGCCNAPVVQINDNYFEDLDEDNFRILIDKIKSNENLDIGSQIGRKNSEPKKN